MTSAATVGRRGWRPAEGTSDSAQRSPVTEALAAAVRHDHTLEAASCRRVSVVQAQPQHGL